MAMAIGHNDGRMPASDALTTSRVLGVQCVAQKRLRGNDHAEMAGRESAKVDQDGVVFDLLPMPPANL